MTRHLPFLCLLLCGCSAIAPKPLSVDTLPSSIINPSQIDNLLIVGKSQPMAIEEAAAVVQPPAQDIYIPITWPSDWQYYSWQVFGSSNLLDWQLVVTNVDMSADNIDVPKMGRCGFYRLKGTHL